MLEGALERIVSDFSAVDAIAGHKVSIDGRPVIAIGIAPDGRLRVRDAGGTESCVAAADVSLHGQS